MRIKPVLTESIWLALGQVSSALGAILGVRLLTGHLNPSTYGELALWTTIATLINQTILGPLSNGITRFYAPSHEMNDFTGYMHSVNFLVKKALLCVALLGAIGCVALFARGNADLVPIAAAFIAFSAFTGCSSILSGIQNAARRRKVVAFFQGTEPWSRFLTATALVALFGATSENAAFGYLLASAAFFWLQYHVFTRDKSHHFSNDKGVLKDWSSEIWRFSWPFASWGLFTWARLASDRWALDLFDSKEKVGYYAVVFQLGYYPMSLATGMATQLFAPILYQRAEASKNEAMSVGKKSLSLQLVGIALFGTLCAFLLALLLHDKIFAIFASANYTNVSYLLPWVILSGGIFASAQLLALELMTQLKTNRLVVCTVVTSLMGITFNFAAAYYFSIDGVVGAGIIYSITYFLWVFAICRKIGALPDMTKAHNSNKTLK